MTTVSDSECSYVANLADFNVMRVIIIVIVIKIIVIKIVYNSKKSNNSNSYSNNVHHLILVYYVFPQLVKRVLIHSLIDLLCMLLQHCGMPLI